MNPKAEAFWNEMPRATIVLSKEKVDEEWKRVHNEEIYTMMLVIKWKRFGSVEICSMAWRSEVLIFMSEDLHKIYRVPASVGCYRFGPLL